MCQNQNAYGGQYVDKYIAGNNNNNNNNNNGLYLKRINTC